MVRAGVFIGVDQTGHLQKLNDAAAGAKRMHEWALSQGMIDRTHAKLVTDENNQKVKPELIYDAIKEIIDGPGVDQLIIYFAGHGVNINRNEQWLLTEAPVKANAAVNVTGSVELARYSGIQHVVIISDACRVAPEGIQAQNVRGDDIFPNDNIGGKAKPVDQFFACLLGKTSAELMDPTLAAKNYTALYTTALLDALTGAQADVLEQSGIPADNSLYVRPVKLESYLESEVPLRVKAMGLQNKVNQDPDAILIADVNPPTRWISRIDPVAFSDRSIVGGLPPLVSPSGPTKLQGTMRSLMRLVTKSVIHGHERQVSFDGMIEHLLIPSAADSKKFAETAKRMTEPFGPDHFETQCGIKVRGERIVDFFVNAAQGELLGNTGNILRLDNVRMPVSVLLQFEGNRGTVIPAIPGFLAALTFDDRELVDVAYEPSANSWRWNLYMQRAEEVRNLRAVASSSSQYGRFRLDQEDAINIARRMQYAKGVDPTLSIYAA